MAVAETTPGGITRRRFLEKAGVGAAALAFGRFAAAAGPSAGTVIVGSGEHRYEVVHDWLVPPDYIRFGNTHGLAQDAAGRIYVSHTVHPESPCDDAIAVFDESGRFLTSWGWRLQGGAHGLDLRYEGDREFLYHCDTARGKVLKTTLSGEIVWELGAPEESGLYGEGKPFIPTNVALAPNGDFYVTDGYGCDWIHHYTSLGEYLRTFGGKGRDAGSVLNAHGIWVDPRGGEPMLVVADRGNSRLQYFTLDGKHVRFVTRGMRRPCHGDVRGDFTLVPDLDSVVTVLDADGRVAAQLGDGHPSNLRGRPREEFIPGRFVHPHDAIFLRSGDILVAEWVPTGRITLLKRLNGA
jgi:hypothetical protein